MTEKFDRTTIILTTRRLCFVSIEFHSYLPPREEMSRRKQARPIRHLDDEDGGGPDGVASVLDGQEDDVEASTTGAGKSIHFLT